jgi:hypothetical protein
MIERSIPTSTGRGPPMKSHEIEAVARAFYGAMEEGRGWEREPQRLQERFRSDARAAIAILDEHRGAPVAPSPGEPTAPARAPIDEKNAK